MAGEGVSVESAEVAHVLVVAHRTAAHPGLLEAVRQRAELGPARFHLLVPNPTKANWHLREWVNQGEFVFILALPLLEQAAGGPVDGSVSVRYDPMDAIEDALRAGHFDEIILSTLPRSVSRWLHIDLPRRVAHLGLPVTTVVDGQAGAGGSSSFRVRVR
jgi:hypothetical protein